MFDISLVNTIPFLNHFKSLDIEIKGKFSSYFSSYIRYKLLAGFATGTDPFGKSWAPLSPTTLAIKAKKGSSDRILVDTGKMMNSLLVSKTSDSVSITISHPAPFHQTGFTSHWSKRPVPARLLLPEKDGIFSMPDVWERDLFLFINNLLTRFSP